MDYPSFVLANRLIGNDDHAAVLENTLSGVTIRFTTDCTFAITGADMQPQLDGTPLAQNQRVVAHAGSTLTMGYATAGLRSYIAFRGGIVVPVVQKSRATNLQCGLGGLCGRALRAGDELALGDTFSTEQKKIVFPKKSCFPSAQTVVVIRVTPSTQYDFFSERAVKQFTHTTYTVSSQSNRMGIRLDGTPLDCDATDIISDAIPLGAVQITSAGLPVVMAQDRQTCGGYAKIACVIRSDMALLAQCPPQTSIQFTFVTQAVADKALQGQGYE